MSKYPRKSPAAIPALALLIVIVAVALLCVPVIVGVRFADRFWTLYLWLAAALVAVVAIARLMKAFFPAFPKKIVLRLDLTEDLPEEAGTGLMDKLPGRGGSRTLLDVVQGLEKAAADKRVVGLFSVIGPGLAGGAKIAEVRDAIAAFRASGKRAVAFSETFGEVSSDAGSYHLATAFDEIVLQPSGDVGIVGVYSESPFLRGALDKAGIQSQMDQRHEYKNAMNMFMNKKFTKAHKESQTRLVESSFEWAATNIADRRRMALADFRDLIDRGPFLGEEAVDEGLVDRLGYYDEVVDRLEKDTGAKIVAFGSWWKRAQKKSRGATIALVYGVGAVVTGKSRFTVPFGRAMGSETVAEALRKARKDKSVKAVVFRIDSPGGSYVASDTIWREVVKAKADGKPVIATMGNVAGSGGYFVAMAADKIVAQPSTLTGSIGVLGGKHILGPLRERFGITTDSVQIGAAASMFSANVPYSDAGWARFQAWLDRVYEDFTSKAAEGRGMDVEELRAVAKGRVWTGVDALANGLVDELGGFPAALRLAREAAGLQSDATIKLKTFPEKKGLFASLRSGELSTWFAVRIGLPSIEADEIAAVGEPWLAAARAVTAGEVSMEPQYWA
jgi:protease IV